MVTRTVGAFVLLTLAAFGCETEDPLYCDDETACEDPERPFCDLEGTYPASEGHGRTCIAEPTFELTMPTDDLYVRTDSQVEVEVMVVRTDGFPDEILLTVQGLPDGAAAEPISLATGETSATIVLDAGTASAGAETTISIVATAGERQRSADTRFVVLGPAGSLDPTFGSGGLSIEPQNEITDEPNGLAVLEDGTFFVGGHTSNDPPYFLMRYSADGVLDTSFGNDGIRELDFDSLGLQSCDTPELAPHLDGMLFATMTCSTKDDSRHMVLARFRPDGTFDPDFGDDGIAVHGDIDASQIDAIATDEQGDIVTAVTITGVPAHIRFRRFNSIGEADETFGGGVLMLDRGDSHFVNDMTILPDRSIIGSGSANDGTSLPFIFRITAQGAMEDDFGTDGVVTLEGATSLRTVVPLADGEFVAAGVVNGERVFWRLNADGTLDEGFGQDGQLIVTALEGASISALLDAGDGYVLGVGGGDAIRMVRFDAETGQLDSSFGTAGIETVPLDPTQYFLAAVLLPDYRFLYLGYSDGPDPFLLARFFR